MPKSKRKKITVKINNGRKSSENPMEIDLKSVIDSDHSSTEKPRKAIKKKKEESHSVSQESKQKSVSEPAEHPVRKGPQLNLYRKIAYSFIVLTLALLAVIFYFSFIKVTITIIPMEERISNNLIIDIIDKEKNETMSPGEVSGVVESIEVKEEKIYKSSGSEIIGGETTGKVIIINNYNKNQPLVATTRLLSPDNKLFRIKNTVNVPAGGTAEVEVYADKPGSDTAIGPTKFTIPGLWAGLQDKIYAESKEAMEYIENAKKSITQSDIDNGIKDIRDKLLKKAEKEVGEKYKNYNQTLYDIDENSVSIDIQGKVGEEKNEFIIVMTTAVVVVAFDDESIKEMAKDKLTSVIASDKSLKEFNENNIIYSLDAHKLNQGTATVNVTFEGKVVFKSGEDIIDREKIVGLTREQLNVFLGEIQQIESYEIKFQPAFIDKVPNLVDRIKVKIK